MPILTEKNPSFVLNVAVPVIKIQIFKSHCKLDLTRGLTKGLVNIKHTKPLIDLKAGLSSLILKDILPPNFELPLDNIFR